MDRDKEQSWHDFREEIPCTNCPACGTFEIDIDSSEYGDNDMLIYHMWCLNCKHEFDCSKPVSDWKYSS